MKITIKLGKGKDRQEITRNIRPEWIHQLPVLAAMCSQAEEDWNPPQHVQDALELLLACEEAAADAEIT